MKTASRPAHHSTLEHVVRRFWSDETGQDLIEYALLAGSIGLVGIVAWDNIRTGIGSAYQGWDSGTQAVWHPQDPV